MGNLDDKSEMLKLCTWNENTDMQIYGVYSPSQNSHKLTQTSTVYKMWGYEWLKHVT